MAICWWIIFASWLYLLRYVDSKVMSTHLLRVHLLLPLYHIFCICQSHPHLSSASHTFHFDHPVLDGNCKSTISGYIYSLQKATVWRILCPCDFPVESGNFPCRVFVIQVFRSSCVTVTSSSTSWSFSFLKQCILYLPALPVPLGILQLISSCSLYFFLLFCIICGLLLSLIFVPSKVDITLLQMKWMGDNGVLLVVFL